MKLLKSRVRLSVKLDYTIIPVDVGDLRGSLKKLGYVLPPAPVIPAGSGANLEVQGGPIAQLGECVIDADIRRGVFGAEANSVTDVLSAFGQLVDILEKDIRVDTGNHRSFTEFIGDFTVEGEERAIDTMRSTKLDLIESTDKSFGEPTALFGIRFGPKEHDPSGPNWFDLRIEPLLRNPQVYFVGIVYRGTEAKRVLKMAEASEDRIARIIASLEKPGDTTAKTSPTTTKSSAPGKSKSRK